MRSPPLLLSIPAHLFFLSSTAVLLTVSSGAFIPRILVLSQRNLHSYLPLPTHRLPQHNSWSRHSSCLTGHNSKRRNLLEAFSSGSDSISPSGEGSEQDDDDDDDNDDSNDEDDDENESFLSSSRQNLLQIDFRTFLTQCSIQSFMFLLRTTRDPHTVRWLDNFTRPTLGKRDYAKENFRINFGDGTSYVNSDDRVSSKLLQYHGLGALNITLFPTWDSYFRELLDQRTETLVIEVENDPRFKEFEIEIEPVRLCSRILSVREQIAKEWIHDLKVIADMGGQMFYSYWENVKKEREDREKKKMKKKKESREESENDDRDEEDSSSSMPMAGFERPNLLFLEFNPNQDSDYAPSPLRKGNFDLLVLLTTQESVHRVLRQGVMYEEEEAPDEASTQFLRNFYSERLQSHFSGSQRYGRAHDFIEELMLIPPRMITAGDQVTGLVDPLRIAEVIILEREKVAMEWRQVATDSPQEHMEIRRLQLNRMMGK